MRYINTLTYLLTYIKPIIEAYTARDVGNNDENNNKQESPAVTDKPARRESMPKIAPIRRAYNLVADNTGLSSFV